MRILMFSDYFPPHLGGGVEKVVAELSDGLVRKGHTVAVLTLRTCNAPAAETNGALTIYRVPAVNLSNYLGVQLAVSMQIMGVAARLIRDFRPDVIHAHNMFFRTTEAAALMRKLFHIPLVTTLHLGRMDKSSRLLGIMVHIYESIIGKFIIKNSDHIIAVSNEVAENARRIGGDSVPVTVVPNGVDASLFRPDSKLPGESEVVLFVARLVHNKGPQTLIKAIPLVLRVHPQAKFVFVGDGPLKSSLQDLAAGQGIYHAVRFLGIRDDVHKLMRKAVVFVRPSTLEGMPLTILEAMASALPVIATPVAGNVELVRDGYNGYLVPAADHTALADRIITLLDDSTLAGEMGLRARDMVLNRYTWNALVDRTEQVYEKVVAR